MAASAAVAIALAACRGHGEDDHQAAAEAAVAEIRTDSPREDPALAEQRRLAGQLASLEQRQASLEQSFTEHDKVVEQSERAIRDLNRTLDRQKAETSRYIDQHQVQVACAFAAEAARGEGEYSEQARKCAEVAQWYCAIGMISGPFRREVAAAKQYVEEAETRARSLKSQIASWKNELETQRSTRQAVQHEIDRTSFEIAALRQKLGLPDRMESILPRGPDVSSR